MPIHTQPQLLNQRRRKIIDLNPINGGGIIRYCHAKCESEINLKQLVQIFHANHTKSPKSPFHSQSGKTKILKLIINIEIS